MKILLVEDHLALAEMSCRLLADLYDHEVVHAATGTRALEEFAGGLEPNLVLVDINLPDMDGYEVARRIRRLPGSEVAVLVALTGFGTLTNTGVAHAAGFDAHFRKPMDFGLLPSLLRRN